MGDFMSDKVRSLEHRLDLIERNGGGGGISVGSLNLNKQDLAISSNGA